MPKVRTIINETDITASSGGGSTSWGNITGTLSNQTDLQAALNGKESKLPNAEKAGQVLRSTDTSGGVRWDNDTPGHAEWGLVVGEIDDQTDLINRLDQKVDYSYLEDNYYSAESVDSKLNNKITKHINLTAVWAGTQAEYDAIGEKDPTTVYFIK